MRSRWSSSKRESGNAARVEKIEDTRRSPSQDYGFPKGEEDLVDHDDQPLEETLLRCFPEVGVFSLRDKKRGKRSLVTLLGLTDSQFSVSKD